MPLDDMMRTHTVTLVAPDGARQENVRCQFFPPDVILPSQGVDIAEDFLIEHVLPSGRAQVFIVTQVRFFDVDEPFYELRVGKYSEKAAGASSRVVYNVSGPNARVNIGSSDSSINITQVDVDALFDRMRSTARTVTGEAAQEQILAAIARLEGSRGSPNFVSDYQRFVAVAADHLTLFGPFLPALAQLILQWSAT